MGVDRERLPAGGGVPELDGTIEAGHGDPPAGRAEGDGAAPSRGDLERELLPPRGRVPHLVDAFLASPGQPPAIGTEAGAVAILELATECNRPLPGGNVPA